VSVSEKPLHIDIPVKLADVKVVFSVGALAFEGDLPASMFHLQLIENDIADWNAKSQVVAVFHTNAGHVTLHDIAYNADRNIATGNPHKELHEARCANRVMWRDRESSQMGKLGLASRNQGQHGCHGANDAARSRRIREDLGMSPRPGRERSEGAHRHRLGLWIPGSRLAGAPRNDGGGRARHSGRHALPSFRGPSAARAPGIHNHRFGLWIPGSRLAARPGMTAVVGPAMTEPLVQRGPEMR